jgi:hypothetical protein
VSFLSVNDLRARWRCSKSFVYSALAEMERNGYLRRLRLGRVQRIAMESVEQYEAAHTLASALPRNEQRKAPKPGASAPGDAIRALRVA